MKYLIMSLFVCLSFGYLSAEGFDRDQDARNKQLERKRQEDAAYNQRLEDRRQEDRRRQRALDDARYEARRQEDRRR